MTRHAVEGRAMTRRAGWTLLILIGLGILAAGELFYIDYKINFGTADFKSFCNINQAFNCDAVAASPYASFLGIPLAFWGMMLNLFLWGLIYDRRRLPACAPYLLPFLLVVTSFEVLFCLYLAYVSTFILQTFCLVCMIFWAVTLATFGVVLLFNARQKWPWPSLKEAWQAVYADRCVLGIYIGTLMAVTLAISGYLGWRHYQKVGAVQSTTRLSYDKALQEAYLGAVHPQLEVVMYTDFQCGWCRQAHYEMHDLLQKYADRVRFVRKDFPLDQACNPAVRSAFHQWACLSARYARCAGEQGRYGEFHDAVLAKQALLNEELLAQTAQQLGLHMGLLKECLNAARTKAALLADIEDGLSFKVSGTPSFRVFMEVILGRLTEEKLLEYLGDYPWLAASTVKTLIDQAGRRLQILDLSLKAEYQKGHLPYAVHVELGQKQTIDVNAPTIIYDRDGHTTFLAFEELKKQGVKQLFILKGGYQSWQQTFGR